MKEILNKTVALVIICLVSPITVHAIEYTCTIKNTTQMNENGYFVRHGWAANYENREFTVDRETGKVLNTTALKQRLSNYNKNYKPTIINKDRTDTPFRVITHFEDSGNFALLEIRDHNVSKTTDPKPFYYHTDIGMILSGTCSVK